MTRTNHAEVGDVLRLKEGRAVVVSARMAGGGQNFDGPYPDGWQVAARLLTDDLRYDENGELVVFYQSGAFCDIRKDVEVIGRMKMAFTWVPA